MLNNEYKKVIENHPQTLIFDNQSKTYNDTDLLTKMFNKDTDLKNIYETTTSGAATQNGSEPGTNNFKSEVLSRQHQRQNSIDTS